MYFVPCLGAWAGVWGLTPLFWAGADKSRYEVQINKEKVMAEKTGG